MNVRRCDLPLHLAASVWCPGSLVDAVGAHTQHCLPVHQESDQVCNIVAQVDWELIDLLFLEAQAGEAGIQDDRIRDSPSFNTQCCGDVVRCGIRGVLVTHCGTCIHTSAPVAKAGTAACAVRRTKLLLSIGCGACGVGVFDSSFIKILFKGKRDKAR